MKNHFIILTSPPASGKTFLVENLLQNLTESFLFVSPLRALANECLAKWGHRCQVVTPEEALIKKIQAKIVILDEFHLYFYWGDTFRPAMWEAFYELVSEAELVIALTATLTTEMIGEIKNYGRHFEGVSWINYGNQKLKNRPNQYIRVPNSIMMGEIMEFLDHKSGTNLVFCKYRSEVERWHLRLSEKGFSVWSCIGGEASLFSLKVQAENPPQFIVATTVLSHGVNLPGISRIFFLYPVENLDFWIQMVARGGRRGEAFDVYALENPNGLKWNRLLNVLAISILSLKMKWQQSIEKIQEWFLKA